MLIIIEKDAIFQVFVLGVLFAGLTATYKTPKGPPYRKSIADQLIAKVYQYQAALSLLDRYFAVRDPFNESSTQYRFNLSEGQLYMKHMRPQHTDSDMCGFSYFRVWYASCIFPVTGSFATYEGKLSYGRDVRQEFNVTVTVEQYSGDWTNPADIYANFGIRNISGKARMKLIDRAFVTEFVVVTNSSPPFNTFEVFNGNNTLAEEVWKNFTDYIFRICKQNMRTTMKDEYTTKLKAAADAVGEIDYQLLQE